MAATERPFSSRGPSVAGGGISVRSEARYPDLHPASTPAYRPAPLNTLGTVLRMILTSDHRLQ
jgi:hypothetical protein